MSFFIDEHTAQVLGQYRLLRLLGQGEFAVVYLAEHVHLKTLVAMKVLAALLQGNETEVFLEEARTLARLSHPHIVRVLDFGVVRETPFLALDYAPDGTLRHLHPSGTTLPLTPVVRYVKQIAAALQYAHDHQVIHRDVRPENMLVGQHNQVLLSDFGIAVVSQPPSNERGRPVGTSAYGAPEQLRGQPCPASDQYALGIVAYEWLAGRRPFDGSALELRIQHQSRQPPPLHTLNPCVSAAIEAVVLRALEKRPEARWPSVLAFVEALEQACTGESSYIPGITLGAGQHPFSFGRTHTSPLVGREQEWEALYSLLLTVEQLQARPDHTGNDAVPGYSPNTPTHCALLVGELGMGKTRLAEDISREAHRRGWTVAWSHAYAHEGNIPYQLWSEVLQHLSTTSGAWSIQVQNEPGRTFAPLLRLLGEYSDQAPPEASLPPLTPEQERWQLWEAVGALLTRISQSTPLMVVLDDLHWADESSLELLAYLLRRLDGNRVMVVGTFRHTELPQAHLLHTVERALRYERHTQRLLLQPLTQEQIRKLLPRLPADVVLEIQALAGGNPFFAEELAREEGAPETTRAVLPPHAGQRRSPLPGPIAAALERRINRISANCLHLLSVASVMGGSFTYPTLCAMMDENQARERGLDLLDEAIEASILIEEGSRSPVTYSFWHPLMVQFLYERLPAARRVHLHRAAATTLMQLYQGREEEGAAAIVPHLVECGSEPLTIARYAELAADRAFLLSAYPEATRQYRLAVSHLEEAHLHPPTGEEPGARRHLADLLERLGECLMNQGSYEGARGCYERVIALRGQLLPHPPCQGQAGEVQILALLWSEIGRAWRMQGQYGPAGKSCESGEAVLREAGINAGPAQANLRLQSSLIEWQLGHNEQARALALDALRLFEEMPRPTRQERSQGDVPSRAERLLAGDPAQLGETQEALSNIATSQGQTAHSLSHLQTALSIYEQHDLSRGIAHVTGNLGFTYLLRGEDGLAQQHLSRSFELAERVGDLPVQAVAALNLGELRARTGKLAEAEALFRKCLALTRQVGDRETEIWASDSLSTVCREQGKLADARESIASALRLSRSIKNTLCVGLVFVALGNLRLYQARATCEAAQRRSLLLRAKRPLEKALSSEHLYTEPRAAAHLALAEIAFLLGDCEAARQEGERAVEDARTGDLLLIGVRAQRLVGTLLDAQAHPEQVAQLFEQLLQQCRLHHMRLEEGRTLLQYAEALLACCDPAGADGIREYQQALKYLAEASSIFSSCHAALDFRQAEQLLAEAPRRKPYPLLL